MMVDLTDWLCRFAAVAIEAQLRAIALMEFLIDQDGHLMEA